MPKRHPSQTDDVHTKTESLFELLADRRWHSTKELVRSVGHTFHGPIFHARRRGRTIERRRCAGERYQHEYRLPRTNG